MQERGNRDPARLARQVSRQVFNDYHPYIRHEALLDYFYSLPIKLEPLLSCYGVKLLKLELGEDDGFLIKTLPRGGIIFVNSLHHPGRQRFTTGHELYHYLTGERNERRANKFTAELLMPAFAVRAIWKEMQEWPEPRAWVIKLLSARLAVSAQAAKIRLKELNIL